MELSRIESIYFFFGEIVADDYRMARVFKNHNIDFYCNANRTVSVATQSQEVDLQVLLGDLDDIQEQG